MLKLTRFFVSIAAICLPALLSATVQAADISVNSSCELADAISAANSDAATGGCPAGSDSDTITLTGNITLTAALPEIGSEITIEGNGYTISGNERHQIFWVEETGALTIQNVTLADGRGVDDDDLFDEDLLIGGAIVNWGILNVSGSTFSGNSADWGGAILNLGMAIATISDSAFTSNTADLGAAIYIEDEANVSISRSSFMNNTVNINGGAIANFGTAHIVDSAFTGNSANDGGAIYNRYDASITILDTTFARNAADKGYGLLNHRGGALYNEGEAHISRSVLTENSSKYGAGGAIANWNRGTIIVSESTFARNSAKSAGAIYIDGEASVIDCTFAGNMASDVSGGAIYIDGEASIEDSIFNNNTATTRGGAIASSSYSESSIRLSNFYGNVAAEDGGAMSNSGEVSIIDSNFTNNSAAEDGGAIITVNKASISNGLFAGNSAGDEGGAIRSTEDSDVDVSHSVFRDNSAEDGGAIYSWGELSVSRSTFTNNSAVEEGGAIANHGTASIKYSILVDNPGGDCHLGRKGELLESGNNHISDGSCGATWSGSVADGYCPPGQEQDGVCEIGAPSMTSANE